MSAWIEILPMTVQCLLYLVALLVSAWIEINVHVVGEVNDCVALLVSAWIEISIAKEAKEIKGGRTPCECVD